MIARIWKGWTRPNDADKYETLFTNDILPRVTQGVSGYIRTDLLKRDDGDEVEFTTIFWFESMDAVKQFAGDHFNQAVVPGEVQQLMTRFEPTVSHYESIL
ncbi:antibiotic biosynthesis monooxygenase [Marinobacter halodurans]|uniref:Antibiotic biosynthesis monooxygenase n=1 Tax=Marinobacter halodurans TaxID=2528979 RepID=A0ABY1ZSC0_9GAMM|nr:antibiotic biosynthesis monooxygenase [Marinobacter halodurans]TBW58594.1 antibiotic biosynthesis monooxygenase [Marinobacter halodurans]